MNNRQLEKKLLDLIERKPVISQPGRLMAHLINELSLGGDPKGTHTRKLQRLLEKLETDGLLTLDRAGKVWNGYSVKVDTERAVSTIETETLGESEEQKESEMATITKKTPRHERATLALNLLQSMADTDGQLFIPSVAGLIQEYLDVSANMADSINGDLGRLGLRVSPRGRNDHGTHPHLIEMGVTVVTTQMFEEAEADRKVAPNSKASTVVAPDHEVVAKLLVVIERLEAERDELQKQLASVTESRKLAESKLGEAVDIIDQLNSQLEAEHAARQQVTPEVLAVLKRYDFS